MKFILFSGLLEWKPNERAVLKDDLLFFALKKWANLEEISMSTVLYMCRMRLILDIQVLVEV